MAKHICHLNFTSNYSSGSRVVELSLNITKINGLSPSTTTFSGRKEMANIVSSALSSRTARVADWLKYSPNCPKVKFESSYHFWYHEREYCKNFLLILHSG